MKERIDAVTMVRSMGLGMSVLTKLIAAIEAEGGNPDVLALLTRERFSGNFSEIARAIIQCDWRIPASEMRDRAEKWYRENFEADEDLEVIEEVRNFWWYAVMSEMGLPWERFDDDDMGDSPPVNPVLRSMLDGVTISSPLYIGERRDKIVVDISLTSGPARIGEKLVGRDLRLLAIADARYFDFDK